MEKTISYDNARKSEKLIRDLLLDKSNVIRLTEVHWREGFFFRKFGGEKDLKFVEVINKLNQAFIKKITNNKRFDLVQGKKAQFNHYFYKLTPTLKNFINEETLFWNYAPPNSKHFYGFEDIAFYKNDTMLGSIITHESIITLYLSDAELKKLIKAGVGFD